MKLKRNAFSLRSYLDHLRKYRPNEIFEVAEETSIEFETTAYYLESLKRNPVILFRRLKGFGNYELVTNIFGSEGRFADIAGFESMDQFMYGWKKITNSEVAEQLEIVEDNPPFRVRTFTDDLDIFNLPIPSHYVLDGSNKGFSRYITSGLTTTIDPENEGIINMSFSRIQPFRKTKFAFDAGSHGHLWKYLNISRENGQKLEMSIIIGCNPIFYILAASFTDNEYPKASQLFNLTFAKGLKNRIPIPSDSEIVIEAEFLPDEVFDEGPFAEYTGYMGYDSTKFVAKVKSIMMRDKPLYYDIQPSNASEHVNLFSFPRSSVVLNSLRETLPKGPYVNVYWPHYGGRFLAFAYVSKPEPGLGTQLGLSIVGLDPLWSKVVFVNEGVTALNLESALLNMIKSPKFSDVTFTKISKSFIISSDPAISEDGTTGKLIIETKGRPIPYEKKISEEGLLLKTRFGEVLVSHSRSDDHRVNIRVPDDIDLPNIEQIGWALATRFNPDRDLSIEGNRIAISATSKTPPIPNVPEEVMKKIRRKMISFKK
jgi:UbiD family decarboxylase